MALIMTTMGTSSRPPLRHMTACTVIAKCHGRGDGPETAGDRALRELSPPDSAFDLGEQEPSAQGDNGDTGNTRPLRTHWSARELMAAEFPEPRWAVPGLIAAGITLLAGAPKAGKSWLASGSRWQQHQAARRSAGSM